MPPVSSSSGQSIVKKRQSPLSARQLQRCAPEIHDSVYSVWFETLPSSGFGSRLKGPLHGTFVTIGSVQSLCDWFAMEPFWATAKVWICKPCCRSPEGASCGTATVNWLVNVVFAGMVIDWGVVTHSSVVAPNAVQSYSMLTFSSPDELTSLRQMPRKSPSLMSSKGLPTLTSACGPWLHQ